MQEKKAFAKVYDALRAAESKHPEFAESKNEAIIILGEEFGEVCKSVCDKDGLDCEEMAQVAAVAIRYLIKYDIL